MNSAHEKILDALRKSEEPLTQYDLSDITGYAPNGIRARISELINFFGYNIETIRLDNGQYAYILPEEPKDEDLEVAFTHRKIKETKEAISKYYRILREARSNIKKSKISEVKLKPHNESLVVLNSDFHIGKKVLDENTGEITFNSDIAIKRLNLLMGRNLKKLIEHILSSSNLDEIVILNIGDLIDGESIYYQQQHHIDRFLAEQIELATRIKWEILESLWNEFEIPIREEFVVGNHGKGHSEWEGITNFDAMVHLNLGILRDIVGNENLTIGDSPNSRVKLVDVRGHKVLMRHYAPQQIETASAFRKYAGWLNIYDYDCVVTGHFHSPAIAYFQGRPIIRNGSIVGEDEYSRELGRTSSPSQVVFGVSDKRLPTFLYVVDML